MSQNDLGADNIFANHLANIIEGGEIEQIENVVIITHLPRKLFPERDVNSNIPFNEWRFDENVPYVVITPREFTLKCIMFHLDRAQYIRETENKCEEIYLIIELFGRKHNNTDIETRRNIINVLCEYLNKCEYDIVKRHIQQLIDVIHHNFDIMCNFLEQLIGTAYRCAVMICAVQWTGFTYINTYLANECNQFYINKGPIANLNISHINCQNTRYFTEQLSEDQMEQYFAELNSLTKDVQFTQFIIRYIFLDWLEDNIFQEHLFYWLVSNQKMHSIKHCIDEMNAWYKITFHHNIVIDTLARALANIKIRISTLHNLVELLDFVFATFDLDDHIIEIIDKMVNHIKHINAYDMGDYWIIVFTYLLNILETTTPMIRRNFFNIYIMRRFIEMGNYHMMNFYYKRYFHHISKVRMVIYCFEWGNITNNFFATGLYYDLSDDDRQVVFSEMCKNKYISAVKWLLEDDFNDLFHADIIDDEIISFTLYEPPFKMMIFDRYTQLAHIGAIVKNREDIDHPQDECIICMETLDNTSIVVPNCHHSHQMCEKCCIMLINTSNYNMDCCYINCPMCRTMIKMDKCKVFVL